MHVVTSGAGTAASSSSIAKLNGSRTALKPSASSRVTCELRSDVRAELPCHATPRSGLESLSFRRTQLRGLCALVRHAVSVMGRIVLLAPQMTGHECT